MYRVCIVLLLMAIALPAFAYIDPNAGGYISQLLAPILMIAATGLTFFRRRIASAFRWLRERISPVRD
ncbi:MAG TPA: hypothetical protein VKB79_13740 [Bryobacteraceae bacterium]|nr:hypothetical protein [Bryobacteraceae bacterium]